MDVRIFLFAMIINRYLRERLLEEPLCLVAFCRTVPEVLCDEEDCLTDSLRLELDERVCILWRLCEEPLLS